MVLHAVDREIIRFRECDPTCFRFKKWNTTGPDHFDTPSGKPRHLFFKPIGPEAWLNREYVPHIGAYAKAVIDHGYPIERSTFSLYRDFTARPHLEPRGSGLRDRRRVLRRRWAYPPSDRGEGEHTADGEVGAGEWHAPGLLRNCRQAQ